ncbi:arylformamidase [Ferroacidibacillus organovorans]|uniref:Arylformamidase n=1 Tax=Ferroacidibacillus organovorans TaxID=1765683 RepID=A0A101XR96_9BACL|nr:arylformamidase [Ferroacidibacillus organovorans]KUO96084.1 hypothetical protein ATW55_01575 [Ferroacidibacillus organovorans]
MKPRFYDLSMPLSEKTAPFPLDTPFSRVETMRMEDGDACNVTVITMSVHVGTHVDAPYHYDEQGLRIDEVALERYIGKANVFTVYPREVDGIPIITADDVRELSISAERVLLHTETYPEYAAFHANFASIEPDAIDVLAERGVRLIGVDVPSVDKATSKTLPAHKRCREREILILENLRLEHVPDGDYELIALPLRIAGGDASPVRAVLRMYAETKDMT